MADLLTIDQARAALDWKPGQNTDRDAELTDVYIPAVTEAIAAEFTLPDVVPALAVLIARRVLRRAWNADHQGAGGSGARGQQQPASKVVLTNDDREALWSLRTLGGFA